MTYFVWGVAILEFIVNKLKAIVLIMCGYYVGDFPPPPYIHQITVPAINSVLQAFPAA